MKKKRYDPLPIKQLYDAPKWYLFVPLIGLTIYMFKMYKRSKLAGLFDRNVPGGRYMLKLTHNFLIFFNIFIPIWVLIAAIFCNFPFWFWRKKTYTAIELNQASNVYNWMD